MAAPKKNVMFVLLMVAATAGVGLAADCSSGCGGCKSGRCDVFGCKSGGFCCTNILGHYGSCCATCNGKLPPSCTDIPTTADCSFYTSCLNDVRPCPVVTNVALPKCLQYESLETSLSPAGKQWSQYVRPCLQRQIANNVLKPDGAGFTCAEVESTFFNDHLPCYVDGPISFCNLPLTDNLKIMWKAKDIMWKGHFWQVMKSGSELKFTCDSRFYETVLRKVVADSRPSDVGNSTAFDSAFSERLDVLATDFGWNGAVLTNTTTTSTRQTMLTLRGIDKKGQDLNTTAVIHLVQRAVLEATNGSYVVDSFDGSPVPSINV